jgi:hypothetical protein
MTTHTVVPTRAWVERAQALAPVVEQWRDIGVAPRPRGRHEAFAPAAR